MFFLPPILALEPAAFFNILIIHLLAVLLLLRLLSIITKMPRMLLIAAYFPALSLLDALAVLFRAI